MKQEIPEISVIIPVRNRSEALLSCLQALAAQDFFPSQFEVLVCDDGSTEDLSPAIAPARVLGLDIHLLRQGPRGPAAARNMGIRHARGRLIAMTDSDALPGRMWLQSLFEALESDPQAVGVEGKVCANNQGQFGPLGDGPTNLAGGVFLTCNCAYRRDVLLRIGGFDETFPYPAYEDTELAARAQDVGRIIWQPRAIVMHPERKLTLADVFKKLKHWEYVVVMGYRYGYLAWKQYPSRYPRLRVVLLSIAALPFSKIRTAARWLRREPRLALILAAFGIMESLGAVILVLPRVLAADFQPRRIRNRYLEETPW
jgi:GT2 family glycosyltransferase